MSSGGWPPDLADPQTRLGQLQRGLGSGARAAVAAGPEAADDVLHCLAHDPRWDRQLDSRAGYYADLVIALEIEARDLAQFMETHEQRTQADNLHREPLLLRVLSRLVDQGETGAVEVLRWTALNTRYWADAIDALTHTASGYDLRPGRESHLVGVADFLCRKFSTVEALAVALDAEWQAYPGHDREPWTTWDATHPMIGQARRHLANADTEEPSRPAFEDWPTERLLAHQDPRDLFSVARVLRGSTTVADTTLLRATAADLDATMRPAAIRVLGERGDLSVLPYVLELNADLPRGHYGALNQAIRGLPFEATRATAHAWLNDNTDASRVNAASGLYCKHATDQDVAFVRAMLNRTLDIGPTAGDYIVSNLSQALARNPDRGPYPELNRAFREMPYSFGRTYTAKAIAASDPEFAFELAPDCLWDAEEPIRLLGTEHVDLNMPAARERLRQLATKPTESEEIRAAATERLNTKPPPSR